MMTRHCSVRTTPPAAASRRRRRWRTRPAVTGSSWPDNFSPRWSGAADNAGVAGEDQGGRAPAEDLQAPAGWRDRLARAARGVQVAAGPHVGLDQRQAKVNAQADLLHRGAGAALVGGG